MNKWKDFENIKNLTYLRKQKMLAYSISQKKMVIRGNSMNKCRKAPYYHGVG